MTDPSPTPSFDDFTAKHAAHDLLARELRATNKAALFDRLAAAGITHVVIDFDGYGDSGQIETVEAKTGDGIAPLPAGDVTFAIIAWNELVARPQSLSVSAALEHLVYDVLAETHCGWENGDGAYGCFLFDAAARTISLDYNERTTTSEYYRHEF